MSLEGKFWLKCKKIKIMWIISMAAMENICRNPNLSMGKRNILWKCPPFNKSWKKRKCAEGVKYELVDANQGTYH